MFTNKPYGNKKNFQRTYYLEDYEKLREKAIEEGWMREKDKISNELKEKIKKAILNIDTGSYN
jgi:hypothetical protein